jgi:hypothetical protein
MHLVYVRGTLVPDPSGDKFPGSVQPTPQCDQPTPRESNTNARDLGIAARNNEEFLRSWREVVARSVTSEIHKVTSWRKSAVDYAHA